MTVENLTGRVLVDTKVLIYATLAGDPRHLRAKEVLAMRRRAGVEIFVSVQNLAEMNPNLTGPKNQAPDSPALAREKNPSHLPPARPDRPPAQARWRPPRARSLCNSRDHPAKVFRSATRRPEATRRHSGHPDRERKGFFEHRRHHAHQPLRLIRSRRRDRPPYC